MAFQQPTDTPIKHRLIDVSDRRLELTKWKINVKDTFNLGYLYTVLHDWLVEEGWAPRDDKEFQENLYLQRDNPNFGKELRIRWRCKKDEPLGQKSGVFAYTLDLDFYLNGLKDAEIVWRGQKIKAQKGEFELEVIASLIPFPKEEWAKSPWKSLRDIMLKRTIKAQFGMHKKAVIESSYRLRDFLLTYFKLQTLYPEKEGAEFYTKKNFE